MSIKKYRFINLALLAMTIASCSLTAMDEAIHDSETFFIHTKDYCGQYVRRSPVYVGANHPILTIGNYTKEISEPFNPMNTFCCAKPCHRIKEGHALIIFCDAKLTELKVIDVHSWGYTASQLIDYGKKCLDPQKLRSAEKLFVIKGNKFIRPKAMFFVDSSNKLIHRDTWPHKGFPVGKHDPRLGEYLSVVDLASLKEVINERDYFYEIPHNKLPQEVSR
jgi:hypothetical protein